MKKLAFRLKSITAIVSLSLLFVLFFYRFFLGDVLYCCDNFLITLPAKQFLIRSLTHGILPFWNPNILSGLPYLADINIAPLYPLNIVFFHFPPFRALTVVSVIHLFLAMVGQYWCSRKFKLSRFSSAASAILFTFSGTLVTYTNNLPMLSVVAFLPWIVGSFVAYSQTKSGKYVLLAIVFSSLQILAGHPQLTYITWLFLTSYAVIFFPGKTGKKFLLLITVLLTSFLITGIQLLPFLELAIRSTRLGGGIDYSTFGSLPILSLFRFILPALTGNLSRGTEFWQQGSIYGYIGILPLFSLVLLRKLKDTSHQFLAGAGIIAFLVSFGLLSPLYWFFYFFVPGISLFRVPSHFLLLDTFCTAIVSGVLLEALLDLPWFTKLRVNIFASLCILVGIGIFVFPQTTLLHILQSLPVLGVKLGAKLTTFGPVRFDTFLLEIGSNIVFVGISVWLFLSPYGKILFGKYIKIAVLLFLFIDLGIWNSRGLLTVPSQQATAYYDRVIKIGNSVASTIGTTGRLYIDPSTYPSKLLKMPGTATYESETLWQAITLRPNLGWYSNIQSVEGYSSMVESIYQSFFDPNKRDPTGVVISKQNEQELSLLGVNFLGVLQNSPEATKTGTLLVDDSPLALVPRSNTSRYWLLNDTKQEPVHCSHSLLSPCSFLATSSGIVTTGIPFYPGWKITLDERNTPLESKNGLVSFAVSQGNHIFSLRYDPVSSKIGAFFSVIGFITFIILSLIFLRGAKHSKEA